MHDLNFKTITHCFKDSVSPYLIIKLLIKRIFDLSVCAVLSIVLFPILLLIALAIKLDSRGPVIFKQMRVGQYQRKFECYKFRSMHVVHDESMHEKFIEQLMTQNKDEKEKSTQTYKMTNSQRMTRVGRVLRKCKLDELPQIWNVLKGDMSLVGPRPAIDYEIKYHDSNMLRRFNVKSGITGFWQVHSGPSVDYKEMVEKDLYYVENWSLLLDLKIILKTLPALVRQLRVIKIDKNNNVDI